MGATSILIVEDEPAIASLVRTYLERDGFTVAHAATGAQALVELEGGAFALVLLDLGLPDMDGLDVARRIDGRIPVIALTARDQEPERMQGFAAGVDDYVPKPFSPREVVARVRAVLRRAAPAQPPAADLVVGRVTLSPGGREALVDGRAVELTLKEFDLLWLLLSRPGTVLTREALLEHVWGYAAPGASRTVDQHVAQLRRKLGVAGLVVTVRGVGYKGRRP